MTRSGRAGGHMFNWGCDGTSFIALLILCHWPTSRGALLRVALMALAACVCGFSEIWRNPRPRKALTSELDELGDLLYYPTRTHKLWERLRGSWGSELGCSELVYSGSSLMSRPAKNFSYGSTKWWSSGGCGDRSSRLRIIASASLNSSGVLGLDGADTSKWSSCMWARGTRRGSLSRLILGHR